MTTEWKIRRKQGTCALCGREFEDGERLRSLLCLDGAEIARRDVCEPCRAAAPDGETLAERVRVALEVEASGDRAAGAPQAGDGESPFALYWWSTRHRRDRRATVQLDLDTIERLFLDLEGRAGEKLRELRYLLCLLLMRKRRVKLDAVRRGPDGEALLVHRPRREERLVVFVHDFGPERMEELRVRLQALLEGVEPEALEEGVPEPGVGGGDAPEEGAGDGSSSAG